MSSPDPRLSFLEQVDPCRHFFELFDHLESILFFAKDREGRLFAANTALLRRYGFLNPSDFWGRTDFDLLPRSLAEKFRQDDLRITETGKPMLEIVELFVDRDGVPDWFLTNKRPIFTRNDQVIGVMGTIEPYEVMREVTPEDLDITPALSQIRTRFHANLSVTELAKSCDMSVRQFERKFKRHLKTTPKQLILKMRIHAACDLLRQTKKPIGEIARLLGFYDQSSFTRLFDRHMGITPLQYRKTFR
ncbi:MAG: helix-turn-helix domain-containing protein [Verrucomicrobiota bacterium]